MIRSILLTASVLGLAACNAPEPEKAATEAVPPPVATPDAPAAVVDANALTPAGWGNIRIGMTRAELETAVGPDASPESVGGADPAACDLFRPEQAPTGLMVMVENGMVTSVWLSRGATVKTDRGFGVGDQAAAIKTAYGDAASITPHKYSSAPAEYITAWASGGGAGYVQDPAARGISYHIGPEGTVQYVAAGGPSIQYVEGCA
ncbi:MAG: hypothetical protein JHC81_00390 [Brevundimonas sp.]|uniref:hypothetical protein n=1 Tax=Brevundimonas sp. TaxID=1871086 RepID=UPI001A25FEF1|nr:hypothetical protein [Brevundimonas sp.]MBJ7445966.1 hypothetical protein [Brevundimonas sp.]